MSQMAEATGEQTHTHASIASALRSSGDGLHVATPSWTASVIPSDPLERLRLAAAELASPCRPEAASNLSSPYASASDSHVASVAVRCDGVRVTPDWGGRYPALAAPPWSVRNLHTPCGSVKIRSQFASSGDTVGRVGRRLVFLGGTWIRGRRRWGSRRA
jgi:hypothetical protein